MIHVLETCLYNTDYKLLSFIVAYLAMYVTPIVHKLTVQVLSVRYLYYLLLYTSYIHTIGNTYPTIPGPPSLAIPNPERQSWTVICSSDFESPGFRVFGRRRSPVAE